MSNVSREAFLSVLPSVLSPKEKLAQVIADELIGLYNDTDLLRIYARIDELDEQLLDILAYDFKIDWWDKGLTLDEKRRTVKDHFAVHRYLGTAGAVEKAVSAIYETEVAEWYEYDGKPYHYKLVCDTGGEFPDYDKFTAILEKRKYYDNLRSILDAVTFVIRRTTPTTYVGTALHNASEMMYLLDGIDLEDYTWLIDEEDDMLLDGDGLVLFV